MNNYFKSNEFYKNVADLAVGEREGKLEECVSILLTVSFNYMKLNRDDEKLCIDSVDQFLKQAITIFNEVVAQEGEKLSLEASLKKFKDIANKLMAREFVKNHNLENNLEQSNKLIDQQMAQSTIKFHSFNSANLESIKENGIDPNLSNPYQDEIDRISGIFASHGVGNVFGWQKLNCDKKVYYSQTPRVSFSYASRSPEWFSQFVIGGLSALGNTGIDTKAYENRDYDSAKQNLSKIMRDNGFTAEEMQEVYQFFDKFWQKYATKEPAVAVVHEVSEDERLLIYDMFLKGKKPSESIDLLGSLDYSVVDASSTEKIDTKEAMFFSLPTAKELERRVAQIKQTRKEDDLLRKKQ